ncbi:beta-xylosidase, partial [Pseudoalteromonas sp. S1727]
MKLNQLAVVISCAFAVSGCGSDGNSAPEGVLASQPVVTAKPTLNSSVQFNDDGNVAVTNVAVHDPSVLKVDDTYYIFGSHLAAAKSTDLMNWEMISSLSANNAVNESPLFDFNYTTEISEGIE